MKTVDKSFQNGIIIYAIVENGPLEKRLTHMPFTHALTGSNPVRVTILTFKALPSRGAFFYSLRYDKMKEVIHRKRGILCLKHTNYHFAPKWL